MNPELQHFKASYEKAFHQYVSTGSADALRMGRILACEANALGVDPGDVLLTSLLTMTREMMPAVMGGHLSRARRAAEFLANSNPAPGGKAVDLLDTETCTQWLHDILENCASSSTKRQMLVESADYARAESQQLAQRLKLLDHASSILAGSLDYATTISKVAELSIESMADGCIVSLVEKEGGAPKPLVARHRDPEALKMIRKMCQAYPAVSASKTGPLHVFNTGKPELYQNLENGTLMAFAFDEGQLEMLRELRLRSVMIVPLNARGRTLGTITFLSTRPNHLFDEKLLAVAEELARRAAMAIDNARLYQEAQHTLDEARQNEQAFRTLAEEVPQFVWVAQPDGNPVFFNQRFYDYTGLVFDQMEQSGWKKIIHCEDRKRAWKIWREALESGEPPEATMRIRKHDGSYRWFLGRGVPLRNSQGQILRWFGTATDIDKHKCLEEKLRISEERYRKMIRQAPFSIQTFTPAGDLIQTNPATAQIWGGPLGKVSGYNILKDPQLVSKGAVPVIRQAFEGKTTNVHPIEYEPALSGFEGRKRWVDAVFYPLKNSRGEILEVVLMMQDITEQREAQEGLRRSEARFRRLAESNMIGITVANGEGVITEANDAFLRPLGYSQDDVSAGRLHWEGLLAPEHRDGALQAFKLTAAGNSPVWEAELLHRHGRRVPVLMGAAGVEPGNAGGATIGFTMDLTSRREAERNLRESEERFRSFLNATSQIVWTRNARGEFTKYQSAWSAYTGQTADEMLGLGWLNAVHPEDRPRVDRSLQEGAAQVRHYQEIYRLRRHDGVYRHMIVRAVPIIEAGGAIREWVGAYNDITDRYLAEEALRESEERFRLVVKCVEEYAIYSMNMEGRITTWNPGAERIFGYSEQEAIGMDSSVNFLTEDRQAGIPQKELEAARSGAPTPDERWHRRKDGSQFWGSGYVFVLRNPAGDLRGFVKIVRDETARKQAEERIRQANEALAVARDHAVDASRAKSAFLANVSHELRTPLNAVIGYSEMLQEEAEEQNLESFLPDLRRINSAGRHLLSVISDILDLSKIEAGKMDLVLEEIDVHELLQGILSSVEPLAANNENHFEMHEALNMGTIRTDETKLRQILINLVGNACKFTDKGRITLDVTCEGQGNDGFVIFTITDNGIGMNADLIGKLFSEFSQADVSSTRRYGGTGLGLALSRRFTRMLGGDISVTSQPGQGSTFTVRLPIVPPTDASGGNGHGKSSSLWRHSGLAGPTPGPGHNTVLVIDHDPEVHDLIRRTLQREGLEVVAAGTGKEGLELAQRIQPAAILLDVLMPDIDGWSLLAILKTDPELSAIPVIVLSIIEERNLGFALGASDYLTKPVERERLVKLLRRYRCDARRCSILVVDDDAGSRSSIRQLLESNGARVMEAIDGPAAFDQLDREKVDLIFLDLVMPGMDGPTFLEALRNHDEWNDIPVVVITGKTLSAEEVRSLSGNVERIVQKSGRSPSELLDEVRDLLVR